MKTASIYKLPNKGYIVFGKSKTESGIRIASEPYFNFSETEANADVVANAVKEALCNDDNKRLPNPKDWKQLNNEFLKKINLKSMNELDSGSNKYVSITEDRTQITFTPSRPAEKPDKGFLHKDNTDSIIIDAKASNREIMEALESALNKCG